MALIFDAAKKAEGELVLEESVPLRIQDRDLVYLMTNDFTVICEKLRSFGCRIPKAEDFRENPLLDQRVRRKMSELGATWSLTVKTNFSILNYLEPKSQTPYILFLSALTPDGTNSSVVRLFHSVFNNDADELKAFVKKGYDINQTIERGVTPLMLAASTDSFDCLKALIELGADINAKDANGQTALMYSTFNNSVFSADYLLSQKEIKIEERDLTGQTALYKAAAYGSTDVFKFLLQSGADVNAVTYSGDNALICSIINKITSIAELLIKSGIDINYMDKMKRTALIVAAQYNDYYTAKRLIKAGANPEARDINGNDAFLLAAENDAPEIIKMLSRVQNISHDEYAQAVVKASMNGKVNSCTALLENCGNKEEMASAVLTSACLKNNPDLIKVCVTFDCDVNAGLFFGMTPLMVAAYLNADKAAAQLISFDADINMVDDDGMTALMYAAAKNSNSVMLLLLRNGADKDIRDKKGKTFEDYTKEFDARSYTQLIMDRMKSKMPEEDMEPKDQIPQKHQSFMERFDWYLHLYLKRYPDKSTVNIYKDAEISKQTFSKIQSNRKANFHPKKETCIQLALGLRLSLNEAEDLLQSAGYVFSEHDKEDALLRKLFSEKNYDWNSWSVQLFNATGKIFFKALMDDEENR